MHNNPNAAFHVRFHPSFPENASPYRLVDAQNGEVGWANDFLDGQRIRGLSLCSLRAYAYDLLYLASWFLSSSTQLSDLNQSNLKNYIRFQLERKPKPAAQTINHRLSLLYSLYRFYHGSEIPLQSQSIPACHLKASRFGYGRTQRVLRGLRIRIPRRVVIPLSSDEVFTFWRSFRTFRDLSIIALMLFNGLRSRETINLRLDDLRFAQNEILVHGKGNRERLLPLAQETVQVLQNFLDFERPQTNTPFLFTSLKGPNCGQPMTPAGLRSLFRHHRKKAAVLKANPHRFRHTFGADMVRAGVSVPALMRLMGHAYIQTTMLYVQLSPQDVWREFHQAVSKLNHSKLPINL
jgi:integrase/recombinase XerD